MNIHPLFVHFPIGILSLYVFIEILRIRPLVRQAYYFELKAILVFLGTVAAFLAASTGDMAEELIHAGTNSVVGKDFLPLVERHSAYAGATIAVFGLLAASYVFLYLKKQGWLQKVTDNTPLVTFMNSIQHFSIPLALLGFILITITGGLGAVLVYGKDIDPIVTIIYTIFGVVT